MSQWNFIKMKMIMWISVSVITGGPDSFQSHRLCSAINGRQQIWLNAIITIKQNDFLARKLMQMIQS